MPLLKAEIRALLHDPKTGRLIKALPWTPANSLLRQFIQLLAVQMSEQNVSIIDILDTARSIQNHEFSLSVNAILAATGSGIVIGTGTNAVTMTDTHLQTQVTADITHSATTFAVENPDANTWRLAISRIFQNNTGAAVGVKEVALYAFGQDTPPVTRFICIDRTLYNVSVPNGIGLTLTYRISVEL